MQSQKNIKIEINRKAAAEESGKENDGKFAEEKHEKRAANMTELYPILVPLMGAPRFDLAAASSSTSTVSTDTKDSTSLATPTPTTPPPSPPPRIFERRTPLRSVKCNLFGAPEPGSVDAMLREETARQRAYFERRYNIDIKAIEADERRRLRLRELSTALCLPLPLPVQRVARKSAASGGVGAGARKTPYVRQKSIKECYAIRKKVPGIVPAARPTVNSIVSRKVAAELDRHGDRDRNNTTGGSSSDCSSSFDEGVDADEFFDSGNFTQTQDDEETITNENVGVDENKNTGNGTTGTGKDESKTILVEASVGDVDAAAQAQNAA